MLTKQQVLQMTTEEQIKTAKEYREKYKEIFCMTCKKLKKQRDHIELGICKAGDCKWI